MDLARARHLESRRQLEKAKALLADLDRGQLDGQRALHQALCEYNRTFHDFSRALEKLNRYTLDGSLD